MGNKEQLQSLSRLIQRDQTTSKDNLPYIIPPKLTIMKNYGFINNYDSWTCKEMGFNCETIPRAEII